MKRSDVILTEEIKGFLTFDLGHMDCDRFHNKIYDIPYCQNEELKLDVYYPNEKKEKYPVFLIVYGGGWISGFKQDKFVEPMIKPIHHGYACVVPDYTLSLDAAFPQSIIDLKNALGWIKTNADEYHFDVDNITIWGESAGGHLCLETALVPNSYFKLEYNTDSTVKNIVSFYPIVNPKTIDEEYKQNGQTDTMYREGSVLGVYLGDKLYDEKALYLFNPTNFIHKSMPNIWMQHGRMDTIVPYQQSQKFVDTVKTSLKEVNIFYEIVEDKIHTDPHFFTDENVARIIAYIESL